jgi:AcrR family transcriptional regulator
MGALLANPNIGVTQIAHRLGVSPATLYRYIPRERRICLTHKSIMRTTEIKLLRAIMAESDAGGPLSKIMWMIIGVAVTALAALPITYYVTPLTARLEITISNVSSTCGRCRRLRLGSFRWRQRLYHDIYEYALLYLSVALRQPAAQAPCV